MTETTAKQIQEIKSHMKDKNSPFGVDLLLPKVGEGARKTNVRYALIASVSWLT